MIFNQGAMTPSIKSAPVPLPSNITTAISSHKLRRLCQHWSTQSCYLKRDLCHCQTFCLCTYLPYGAAGPIQPPLAHGFPNLMPYYLSQGLWFASHPNLGKPAIALPAFGSQDKQCSAGCNRHFWTTQFQQWK